MARNRFKTARHVRTDLLVRNPVFRALGRDPMTSGQQVDVALSARIAFEAVQRGKAVRDDRETLACVVNIVMVLAEKHCSQSELDVALAAQQAILRADARSLQGTRWNFDGEGRLAMLAALDIHEQQIALLGKAAVTDALIEVRQRMTSGQVHRIVLEGEEAV